MRQPDRASGILPLRGIRVVDLTQVIAGPFGTMTLGDLGAEIIKIEAVGRGDRSREIEPIPEYFDTINRNKRSVTLDLKDERGQSVALELLANADVFIESTKPGRADEYGLGYDAVREIAPNIVYCSITGFGEGSPYQNLPAWDMLVQAMSGHMSVTGERGGPPLWSGIPTGDLIAGMYAVQSVLAALYAKECGEIDGEWIEVPMLDAAISWLSARAGHTFGTGDPFPRLGTGHPTIVPFGVFECADARLVIAAGTDSLWREFCAALELDDLAEDERFDTLPGRVENRDELEERLDAVLSEHRLDSLLARLHDNEIPAGRIYDTKTVWNDEHVRKRGLHRTMSRESREDADVIDHPVHFTNLMTELETPPQALGESTDDVLASLGYDDERIGDLREGGVIQ